MGTNNNLVRKNGLISTVTSDFGDEDSIVLSPGSRASSSRCTPPKYVGKLTAANLEVHISRCNIGRIPINSGEAREAAFSWSRARMRDMLRLGH